MKKSILFAILFFAISVAGNAQIHVNIGLQPLWGPTGYDYAEYYYIPDLDVYYDVYNQDYVYFDDGRWVTNAYLPGRFGNVDLYRYHKVVINEPTPWLHHDRYKDRYASYRGHFDQVPIRDSHEQKYWQNPNHPEHVNWHGEGWQGHAHVEGHGHWEEHGHGEGHGHEGGHGHDH